MPRRKPRTKKAKRAAVKETMHEFKENKLHSGSADGPVVKNRRQAIAIALNQSGQGKRDSSPKAAAGRKRRLENMAV